MYYVRNYNNIRYPVPELHHIYFGFGEGLLRFNQCWLEDPDREEQGTFDRIRIQNVRWNNCYDNFQFFKQPRMQKIGVQNGSIANQMLSITVTTSNSSSSPKQDKNII